MEIDPETFGRLSERLARFLGTGTFLFWQTLIVIIWISLNLFAVSYQWDPYPFILLNLAFSTQAVSCPPCGWPSVRSPPGSTSAASWNGSGRTWRSPSAAIRRGTRPASGRTSARAGPSPLGSGPSRRPDPEPN